MFLGIRDFDFVQIQKIRPNPIKFSQILSQFCPNLTKFAQI